jgi:Ca-activated chloride channel family protein
MYFYFPWMALLLPLPILVWLLLPVNKNSSKEITIYFPNIHRLKNAFPFYSSNRKSSLNLSICLLALFWLFFVAALMQPEKENKFIQVKNKGYDLMLAVDVSLSMQAVDLSTTAKTVSRLDATKEVVSRFVLGRQGDRVGLITFGEHAYLQVPLTLDTLSVSKMLDNTAPGMAGNATAIGDAIGLSVRTLRGRPEGSRVLVLLTDGEDNASTIPPLEAAKLAKQYGIKIYTIGIGSKAGSVPFPTNFGGYQMVQISMDEDLLKEIAAITDGQYFSATNQKGLEAIYKKIDELEKTESNENVFFIREPLYRYPLTAALTFLLLLAIYRLSFRRAYGIQ